MLKATFTSWNSWLIGILIFLVPILLIFFLGSQMAYSQVKGQFEPYRHIPEVSDLSALAGVPAGQVVMLRGQIAEATPRQELGEAASDLIIFQVRPADGREVRFQEEFPLVFPGFVMKLPDGMVAILPSSTRERVIYDELHRLTDGEYEQTGFIIGDTVTVQGQWQPGDPPALRDVTGISGSDKNSLLANWQSAFQKVSWTRNILGILTLIGLILLIGQLRRAKRNNSQEEQETWPSQEIKTIPTT